MSSVHHLPLLNMKLIKVAKCHLCPFVVVGQYCESLNSKDWTHFALPTDLKLMELSKLGDVKGFEIHTGLGWLG